MRQDAGALALHSVKWSAASADRIVPPRRSHRVDGAHSWKSISRRRFAKQMAVIADDSAPRRSIMRSSSSMAPQYQNVIRCS